MQHLSFGALGFVAFALGSVAYGHLVLRRNPPVAHVLLLWLAIGVTVMGVVFLSARRVSLAAMNLAVYLFFSEVFIFVYAAAVGSLSIRMLVAMLELDAHPDAFERMLGRCSPDFFLEARLRSMLRQQLICQEAKRYSLTEKGRRWARAARALKAFLAVGRGG